MIPDETIGFSNLSAKIYFVQDYVTVMIKANQLDGRTLKDLVEEALEAWKLIVA